MIKKCFVIRLSNLKYGYVGRVPISVYYVDGTTEEDVRRARRFGEAFGPKRRTFGTEDEAVEFAQQHGVELGEIKNAIHSDQ